MESNHMSLLKPFHKSVGVLIPIGLMTSLFFVVLYLATPSFVSSLNYKITDFIMAGAAQRSTAESPVIIDLDEKSLAKYGQWPWPRHLLADLLQKTQEQGAKSIALDMIFAEADRTSPVKLQEDAQRDLGLNSTRQNIPTSYENHDTSLAKVLAQGPFVLGYEFLFNPSYNDGQKLLHPLKVIEVKRKESRKPHSFFEALGVVTNLEPFDAAVSFSGFLNATPDKDGILRRMPLIIQYKGDLFPSLALATLLQFEERTSIQIRTGKTGSRFVQVGEIKIPIDFQGNVLLNFNTKSEPFPRISASDLLDGTYSSDFLRHKNVLIGSSASGVKPVFQTSESPVFSHVDLHANLLRTLQSRAFPVREKRFQLWEGGGSFLLALVFSLFIIT